MPVLNEDIKPDTAEYAAILNPIPIIATKSEIIGNNFFFEPKTAHIARRSARTANTIPIIVTQQKTYEKTPRLIEAKATKLPLS